MSVARKAARGMSTNKEKGFWVTPDLDNKRVMALIAKLPKSLNVDLSDVVMYLDDTLLGGGEDGMLLTDTHLYLRSCTGGVCGFPKMIITRLSDLQDISVGGIVYPKIKITTPTGTSKIKLTNSDRVKIFCEALKRCIPRSE